MRELSTPRVYPSEVAEILSEQGTTDAYNAAYKNWLQRHTEIVENVEDFRGRLYRVGLHGTRKDRYDRIISGDFQRFFGDVTFSHSHIEDPPILTGLLHGMISKAMFFATNHDTRQFGGIFVLKFAPDTLPTTLGGTDDFYPRRRWTSGLLSDSDELCESLGFNDRGKRKIDLNTDYMHRRMRFRMTKEDLDECRVGVITEDHIIEPQTFRDTGVNIILDRLRIQSMVLELINLLEAKFPNET